jgi:hypothetical protein
MNKYWFVPKTYGYGYVPISIEGWIATICLIGIGIFLAYLNSFFNPVEIKIQNSILFLFEIIILGFSFLKLFEKRCKGKLRFNWSSK